MKEDDVRPLSQPRKRKIHQVSVVNLEIRPRPDATCPKNLRDQVPGESQIARLAFNTLQKPNLHDGQPSRPGRRRFYPLSVAKMVRLLSTQTTFLIQFAQVQNLQHHHRAKYETLSKHIAVSKACPYDDRSKTPLVYFYGARSTIRGTCTAKDTFRKCIILGMEFRQDSPSFRLYLAYLSKRRFHHICYLRFLIKQLVPNDLVPLILSFCAHGLVLAGYEMVGAHYTKSSKPPKPSRSVSVASTRVFSNMWHGCAQDQTLDQINFLWSKARRDVQIHNLRVESKMYANLICGKS